MPERELAGLAGGGGDEHLVGGDVLDPPRARAEHEHVADPGLVDHLLVELADPARVPADWLALRRGQEDAEQAPVGDGAAAGHREPLGRRAGRAASRSSGPRPAAAAARRTRRSDSGRPACRARPRAPAGSARRTARPGGPVRSSSVTSQSSIAVIATICWASTSSGLRGIRSSSISPPCIRRATTAACDQVALVLREDHAPGHVADVVPGPAGALQAAGHRGRRLDLDDQVDRAHVDAELQAGRGHHGGQPAGLQRLLDLGPLLPGDRAVVGPGHLGRRAAGGPGLGHELGRPGELAEPGRRRPAAPVRRAPRPARSAGRRAARPAAASWRTRSWTGAARSGRAPVPRRAARSSGAAPARPGFPAGPPSPGRSCPRPAPRSGGRAASAGRGGDGDRPGAAEEPATASAGRTVADRPMRCAGRAAGLQRRPAARATAPDARRASPASACTSSTMTVSTPRSTSRALDVSSRNSDSGVVIRMSGGFAASLRRSSGCGVPGADADPDVRRA